MVRRRNADGFTYLIALFAVAILGAGLATVGQVWHTTNQRIKETELLFVGNAIRNAIASYYQRTPAGPRRYPPSFEHLLKDPRFPGPVRHLRQHYRDPVTGTRAWGIVAAPDGGMMGVYSTSDARPLKTANFGAAHRVIEERTLALKDRMTYRDWQFVFPPGAIVDTRPLPGGSGR